MTQRFARPHLETLEDRTTPALVAVELTGAGVWLHNDVAIGYFPAGWHQLTPANATLVAVDDLYGLVVAEFPGFGVWRCNTNIDTGNPSWQQLTPVDASSISINYHGGVAANFPGFGVWRFNDYPLSPPFFYNGDWHYDTGDPLMGWQQLTTTDATQVISMNINGDVAANIPDSGVWLYNRLSDWKNLTTASASFIAGHDGLVAAEFQGGGVWLYSDREISYGGYVPQGWQKLTSADASSVGIDSYGNLVAEIPSAGVWRYNQNIYNGPVGWQQLTPVDAAFVGAGGPGSVGARFDGAGVWVWTADKGWVLLTPADATDMAVGN